MKKVLAGVLWLVKSMLIACLVIVALIYYFDSTAPTTTAIVLRDTKIFNDPSGSFESKNSLMKFDTVELVNDSSNSLGFSKIKYDTTQIGFVQSDSLVSITPVYPDGTSSSRILRVDSDKILKSNKDIATSQIIRSLSTHSNNADFIAVYVQISDEYSFGDLAYLLEKAGIPYGYFVSIEKYEQYLDSIVDVENEYDILPIVIDTSGNYISDFEIPDIKSKLGTDTCFYCTNNIHINSNYWTKQGSLEDSFESSKHIAMDLKEQESTDPFVIATFNHESFVYDDFITQYNRLD